MRRLCITHETVTTTTYRAERERARERDVLHKGAHARAHHCSVLSLTRSTWSSSHLIYIFNGSLPTSRHFVLVQRLRTGLAKAQHRFLVLVRRSASAAWNVARSARTNRRRHRRLRTAPHPSGWWQKLSARVGERRAAVVRVQRTLFRRATNSESAPPVLLSCVCACVTVKNVIDL